MVGKLTTTKPSRSDEILDANEQVRITNEIRSQFDDLAPKRPIKPNRSEPESLNPVDSTTSLQNIPELDKFQILQSQSHGVISLEKLMDAQEEFVETQYYKELASIDKQHHTTGSGFIKVVREGDDGRYEIQLPATANHVVDGGENKFRDYKSNPAMNDWVPNLDEYLDFVSSKPNRSESN